MAIGDIIVGLDVGASKVSSVIGQVNKFNEIEVIGYGLAPNSGVKKGRIIDSHTVANSIKKAIADAEAISELSVNSAYVNIKGMNVRIEKIYMESEVERPDDGMTLNDIYNLFTKVQLSTKLDKGEQVIDMLPYEYRVNGRAYKEEPIGAFCRTFGMEVEVIIANGEYIDGIKTALRDAGLKLDGLIIETLATSNIVLMSEEKEMGALLVDIGAGHTDVSVYKNSKLEFYTTIPVGGDHITNDIALTFNISTEEAEKLKRQYNLAIQAMITNNHEVKLNSKVDGVGETVLQCSQIVEVIEARVREIYQIIKKILQDHSLKNKVECMVITGQGISNIVGAEELAMLILKINQVRICSPKLINIIKPQHTTVFGMVRYIASLGADKHVNSDVEIVTELSFKEKIFSSIRSIKDRLSGKSKNKDEDYEE